MRHPSLRYGVALGLAGVLAALLGIAVRHGLAERSAHTAALDADTTALPGSRDRASTDSTDNLRGESFIDAAADDSAESSTPGALDRNRDDRPVDRPAGWPSFADAESRFAEESADPAWSAGAASSVLGNLPLIEDLDLLDVVVECRETLCRVRLLFPEDAAPMYAMRRLYALADGIGLGPLAGRIGVDDNGLPELQLFLRRRPY